VCLDTADVVRDEAIILKNKIEDLLEAGASISIAPSRFAATDARSLRSLHRD